MPPMKRSSLTGDDLRAWRRRFGVTQQDAAHWYGCSERTWGRYEQNKYRVPLNLANRMRSGEKPVRVIRVQDYP